MATNGRHEDNRIEELEAENARLREQNAKLIYERDVERDSLISRIVSELPPTEQEFLKMAQAAPTFGELLAELGFRKPAAAP